MKYDDTFDYRLRLLLDFISDNPGKAIPNCVSEEAEEIKKLAGTFNDFQIVHTETGRRVA